MISTPSRTSSHHAQRQLFFLKKIGFSKLLLFKGDAVLVLVRKVEQDDAL
jgi:hypothetical protein